jgi:flagellar biosynthesis/type III secretory pathway protein FliH
MDGDFTFGVLSEPSWARQSRGVQRPGSGVAPLGSHGSPFLRRDLSEEALRKPVEPLFGRLELAAMRQEGFEAGHAVGLAAAAGSQAAFRTASEVHALEIIAAAMKDGSQQAASVADEAATALAKALIAAMHAVMPNLIQRSALNEVGAMLAHVLPGLSREPTIRVEVPHEIADYIAATLASLVLEHRSKISVIGKDNMGPGEAGVHWGAGHARRQPALVWQAVMEVLDPALGHFESKDTDNGE